MPRRRTELLTDDLYRRLGGDNVGSHAGKAIVLCTVDEHGWPHPAILSYFEVAAPDCHNLRLAVYTNSRTCANMRERGKATLIIVDVGLVCYIRGTVTQLAPEMREAPYNAKLNLRVEQVVFDEPPPDLEPGVGVTSGITYSPRTPDAQTRARAGRAELLEKQE
jgi:Pyridoxamine 5'-phosphate oxidase